MGDIVKPVVRPFTDLLGLAPPRLPDQVSTALSAPPAVEPPPQMPTPNSDAVRQARRRSLASQMGRRGRSSTILSDDTLGGGL